MKLFPTHWSCPLINLPICVTGQPGVLPPASVFKHNTEDLWGRQKVFINRVPSLRGLETCLLQANLFRKAQKFPCSQKNWNPSPCPEAPHIYLFFLEPEASTWMGRWSLQLSSSLSGVHTCGFQSCHHLMQLLSLLRLRVLPDHCTLSCGDSSTSGVLVPEAACAPGTKEVFWPVYLPGWESVRGPGHMCHAAQGHNAPRAGAQQGTSQCRTMPLHTLPPVRGKEVFQVDLT